MNEFRRLMKRMSIRRKYVFLLILRSPFDALRTWVLAGLMKSVFLCLETEDAGRLLSICVISGLIYAILFLYNGTVWGIYAAFSAETAARLEKRLLEKMLSLPYRRVNGRLSGDWITRLNGDAQAALTMMNGPLNIPHVAVAVINTVLSSVLMIKSSLVFFGVTWIFFLPHLLINHMLVLRHIPGLKEESQKAMSESTSAIRPLIADAETILLYDAGGLMIGRCDETSRKLMKINMRIHMRNALGNVVFHLFGIGGYFVILLSGFGLIHCGAMSFADVVYCFQVRGAILAGVSMFVACAANIKANSVCVKRINDTFDE